MDRRLAILILTAGTAATQTVATQTVEGAVQNALNGSPVAGAKVVLQQRGLGVYYSFTDNNGYFRIDGVAEGTYTTWITAQDYLNTVGRKSNAEIQVTAGAAPVQVKAQVMPAGWVTGRVIDGRGDPVKGARVEMAGPSTFQSAQTDANGNFRLLTLPTYGVFTLAASPPAGWKAPAADAETGAPRAWARTLYPGVVLPGLAAPITLRTGGELSGLPIKLLAVPVHTVHGILLDPEGAPAGHTAVELWAPNAPIDSTFHSNTQADGTFEFPKIPEGEWRVAAEVERAGVTLKASEWIEVTSRRSDRWQVRLSPPIPLAGRVIFETRQDQPVPKPPVVRLNEHHAGNAVFAATTRSARSDEDGRLHFENLYPGAYEISIGPAPPGFYLDSMRLGEVPVVGDIELSAESPELTLVYRNDGGSVRGTVENCDSNLVVLSPADAPGMPLFTATCGPDQRYSIDSVRPGDYYALALPGRRDWVNQVDPALLSGASHVTVRAGEITQADLRISTVR